MKFEFHWKDETITDLSRVIEDLKKILMLLEAMNESENSDQLSLFGPGN